MMYKEKREYRIPHKEFLEKLGIKGNLDTTYILSKVVVVVVNTEPLKED